MARGVAAVLVMGLIAVAPAKAVEAPVSQHDLEILQEAVVGASSQLLEAWGPLDADFRHRTVSQDISDWVMNSDIKGELDKFLQQAQDSDDASQAAQQILMDQMRRLSVIESYWCMEGSLRRQRDLWRNWVELVLPQDVARQSVQQVSASETAFMKIYTPIVDPQLLSREVQGLLRVYNDERLKLSVPANAKLSGIPGGLKSLERDIPCFRETDAPTDGGDHLISVVSMPDLEDYYPMSTRRAGGSGRVMLKLYIDVHGCLTKSEVDQSSGDPELDDAALRFSERIHFTPQYAKGVARDGWTRLPVKFALRD
jgi:TonB family protein